MKDKKSIYRFLMTAARPTAAAKTALPIATYVHQLLLVVLFSIYKSITIIFSFFDKIKLKPLVYFLLEIFH